MGTVIFKINNHYLFNNQFIADFISSVQQRKRVPNNCLVGYNGERPYVKNGYGRHHYGEYKGKFIMLSSSPYNRQYSSDFLLTTHQSHYESSYQIYEYFSEIWNEEIAKFILSECELKRFDYWYDFKTTNINNVFNAAYRPKARWFNEINSDRNSKYLSRLATNSNQIIIYEKDIESNKARVESRFTGNKLPIKYYKDIYNLDNFNPFQNLRLIHVGFKDIDLKLLSKPRQKNIKMFKKLYKQKGFQVARKRLNKKGNFTRQVWPIIEPHSKEINLYHRWKKKVYDKFYAKRWF
jgi:hypothetical protein